MVNAEGSGAAGRSRAGTAVRVWGTRVGWLAAELIALTPPLAVAALFLAAFSGMACLAPGSEPIPGPEVHPAQFDPLIPVAVVAAGAFAGVAVWGAAKAKPLVWKTQLVLILVTVAAVALWHDPDPTCTVEHAGAAPIGTLPPTQS
ncbi:hypothetical protein ACWFR1_06470 [Streptomyces sp. NPDC055103]